jgi:hypothetical protein
MFNSSNYSIIKISGFFITLNIIIISTRVLSILSLVLKRISNPQYFYLRIRKHCISLFLYLGLRKLNKPLERFSTKNTKYSLYNCIFERYFITSLFYDYIRVKFHFINFNFRIKESFNAKYWKITLEFLNCARNSFF